MSLFVFKPHVHGSHGVTSPDLVIDRLAHRERWRSINSLSSDAELEHEEGMEFSPAIALTSAGAGTLISPAITNSINLYCVARQAWRLTLVADRTAELQLNGESITSLLDPDDAARFAGWIDCALPKGVILILDLSTRSTIAQLTDTSGIMPTLVHAPKLTTPGSEHRVDNLQSARYAHGPASKQVTHYI